MGGWVDGRMSQCSKMQQTLNGWKLGDGRVWMGGSLIQRPNNPSITPSSYPCRKPYMIRSINQSFNQCIHPFIHPPTHGHPFIYAVSHAVINSSNRPPINPFTYLSITYQSIIHPFIHHPINPKLHSCIHQWQHTNPCKHIPNQLISGPEAVLIS